MKGAQSLDEFVCTQTKAATHQNSLNVATECDPSFPCNLGRQQLHNMSASSASLTENSENLSKRSA